MAVNVQQSRRPGAEEPQCLHDPEPMVQFPPSTRAMSPRASSGESRSASCCTDMVAWPAFGPAGDPGPGSMPGEAGPRRHEPRGRRRSAVRAGRPSATPRAPGPGQPHSWPRCSERPRLRSCSPGRGYRRPPSGATEQQRLPGCLTGLGERARRNWPMRPPTCCICMRLRERLDAMLAREDRTELARACFEFLPTRAKLDLQGWDTEDIFAHS